MTSNSLVPRAAQQPRAEDVAWQQWADRISAAWQKAVEAIVETGRLLIEAKQELRHGQFESMVQLKLPFTPSTARRLMAIAQHPVISNRAHVHVLPPSWGTLYELTKLDAPTLQARIRDGTITPKIERRDVAKLRGGGARELTVDGQPVDSKPSLAAQLKAVQEEIQRLRQREDGDRWKPTDTAQDIAVTMVGIFIPAKAEQIARKMLELLEQRRVKRAKTPPIVERAKAEGGQ